MKNIIMKSYVQQHKRHQRKHIPKRDKFSDKWVSDDINKQVNENLLEICHNYLEGIVWTTKYYFKEKADFIQFPKIVADIKKTLSHSYEKSIDYAKIDFEFFKIYSSSRIAKMIIDTLNS